MKRNEYQVWIDKIRFENFRNQLFPAFVIFTFLRNKSENEGETIDDELLIA